jgi:COX assembly protein 1
MLTLTRREEEVVQKLTKSAGLKACDLIIQEFAACAQGKTVSVVWRCRAKHQAMNQCLADLYTH